VPSNAVRCCTKKLAEKKELSFADADEIERASWTTTVRLVDADDLVEEAAENVSPISSEQTMPCTEDGGTESIVKSFNADAAYGLSAADVGCLRSALDGNGSVIDDETFEKINEAFSENFGDIILEHDGEKYVVIEDYVDDVAEWLESL